MSTSTEGSPLAAAGAPEGSRREHQEWYAIQHMRWANLPVEIAGPRYQCAAIVRRCPESKVHHWHRVTGDGRIAERIARHGAADRRAPDRWRPLPGHAWPHPLPSPIPDWQPGRAPGQHSPAPDAEPEDATQAGDGWPYPGLRLGQCVPPVTIEECEARILRALRTSASHETGHVGLEQRSTCADIPSEYVKIALKYERAQAIARGDYRPEAHAVRSGWSPMRRDIEDWVYALGWLDHIGARGIAIAKDRAADPPWSWRQIGEKRRLSAQGALGIYRAAIARAFAAARGA